MRQLFKRCLILLLTISSFLCVKAMLAARIETESSYNGESKYIGVYVNEPQEIELFQDSLSMIGWFDTFERPSTAKMAICLDDKDYVGFITLEPQGMELGKIADGSYDDKIISYLQMLSEGERVETEIFVRFAHEMEMRPEYKENWYSWQGYDSEAYIEAWQHVVDLGQKYAPNVKWVWSPNRIDNYTKGYYPGDDYVDYVGLTLNRTNKKWKNLEMYYEKAGKRKALEEYNKPIIFSEIAVSRKTNKQQSDYIKSMFDYIKKDDKIVGAVFFNENVERRGKFKFSDRKRQMRTFIEEAKELKGYE